MLYIFWYYGHCFGQKVNFISFFGFRMLMLSNDTMKSIVCKVYGLGNVNIHVCMNVCERIAYTQYSNGDFQLLTFHYQTNECFGFLIRGNFLSFMICCFLTCCPFFSFVIKRLSWFFRSFREIKSKAVTFFFCNDHKGKIHIFIFMWIQGGFLDEWLVVSMVRLLHRLLAWGMELRD